MWTLKLNPAKVQQYAQKFWEQTSYTFNKKTQYKMKVPKKYQGARAFKYLTRPKFEEFLVAPPKKLLNLHSELFTYILNVKGKSFVQKEWEEYKADNKCHSEYAAITDIEIEAIEHFFNYKSQISDNTEFSYYIAELLNTNTCTYCNRQYTLTVRTTEGKRLIRPEFDHWFAQSRYPEFALSFYNLIPSCSFCNSILKNEKETVLDKHIHPYMDTDAGFEFTYNFIGKDTDGKNLYGVDCNITAVGIKDKRRVKETLELFRIKEVYNAHAGLELKDLIDLATANPGDYIDELVNHVLANTHLTKEDVFRILFGVETLPNRYLNRPFSKFKMDIISKIHDIIINGKK